MNPGENLEKSEVRNKGTLVVLVKIKMGQGFSNPERFFGDPS